AAFLRTANAAAYATLFNQFCAENNISKAEVKTYFDRNIAAAVAAEVDAQFNRVSFLLENYSTNSRISYDVVLTRTPTNQYVLKYDRASVQNDDKELSGTSLEALLAVMSRSGDFTQSAVNTVRAQAALIPAVVYADWSANHGVVNGLDTLKGALTDFYLAPNQANYNVLLGIYAKNRAIELGDQGNPEFPRAVLNSLVATLSGLNTHLAQKVTGDMQRVNIRNTALALTGAKYQAFDIPYATR
ncbi:MAG: hypothetical protein LBQ46_04375, partial [Treponema sp.]|nr:hypothetical protein [Treponema sp.]